MIKLALKMYSFVALCWFMGTLYFAALVSNYWNVDYTVWQAFKGQSEALILLIKGLWNALY